LAPVEIEIGTVSTAKSGLLLTSFLSDHESIWSRNPTAYTLTAHFVINLAHNIGFDKKITPTIF